MSDPHPPYRHVACFVDRRAEHLIGTILGTGRSFRRGPAAALSVVHVAPTLPVLEAGLSDWPIDPDDPLRPVRAWLEEVASAADGAQVATLSGEPAAEAAAAWVEASGADLLVVAAASTAVQRTVLGSFAAGLASRTGVPMVVVPPGAGVEPPAGDGQLRLDAPAALGHVAACVDDSPAAAAALEEAVRLRDAIGVGRLTLVRAALPPRPFRWRPLTRLLPAPGGPVRRARQRLEVAASRVSGAGSALVVGHPREVCRWAADQDVDLIVAGTHGDAPGPRLPGGFARHLALHAPCPVMLVPPPGSRRADGG